MRPFTKHAVGIGALMLAALVGFGSAARAQPPTSYYYPSAGWYETTAGSLYISAPGYYYNVPATAAAPTYAATPLAWGYASSYRAPSYRYAPGRTSRGPHINSPPYYSGAQHSLHGRGHGSGQHGR